MRAGEKRGGCCTSCSLRQLFDDRPDTKPGFISIFPVGIRNAGKRTETVCEKEMKKYEGCRNYSRPVWIHPVAGPNP